MSTPAQAFTRVVSFPVAAGSLALLAQPWISARYHRRGLDGGGPALLTGLLAVSADNGYFGAGMLAGSMTSPRLARRLPAGVLRWLATLLAARLWIQPD